MVLVNGKAYTTLPEDLFIPPDALEILLESFSGPLDLLLYLIRKQNMDIMNIPMVMITRQYLQYIELMEAARLTLAADYLVMAATLAEIKSRCLLPVIVHEDTDSTEDPRMELVRRLQMYETMKMAASELDGLPRLEREYFHVQLKTDGIDAITLHPEVPLSLLLDAFREVILRQDKLKHHEIHAEPLSVRERMTAIMEKIANRKNLLFTELINPEEGAGGVVVSLLAILELTRQALIRITQTAAFEPLYIEVA